MQLPSIRKLRHVRSWPTSADLRGAPKSSANRLSIQRPRLAFQVKVGDTATLLNHDLRERNIDLFFARMWDIKEDDLNTEILFEEPFFVVAGINYSVDALPQAGIEGPHW